MEKWGYREYRQWILSEMRMYYPPNEGFAVYTQWIEKNNISLEAIIIRHVTEQEVPVFYLKDFYGAYRGGVPLQGTAMHICRLYECRRQLRAPFGELSDFGAVKDKLRIHLVEKEGNQRYLEEGPYRILTLGAAIVTAEVLDTPDGKFCARVTEELLRGYGISDDRLFEYQSQIIRNLADQESCVIVGKCADYVLKGRKNVVSIYIEAPRAFCLERTMQRMKVSADVAAATIENTDKYRADYYKYYTKGNYWTNPVNYDMTLNSEKVGIAGCVKMIEEYLVMKGLITREQILSEQITKGEEKK